MPNALRGIQITHLSGRAFLIGFVQLSCSDSNQNWTRKCVALDLPVARGPPFEPLEFSDHQLPNYLRTEQTDAVESVGRDEASGKFLCLTRVPHRACIYW